MKDFKKLTACVLALLLFGMCLLPAFAETATLHHVDNTKVPHAATVDEATPDQKIIYDYDVIFDKGTSDETKPGNATPDEATPDETGAVKIYEDAIEITLIDADGNGKISRIFTGDDRMEAAVKWIVDCGGDVTQLKYTGSKTILYEVIYPDDEDEDSDEEDEDLDDEDEDSDDEDEDSDDEDEDSDDEDEDLDDEDEDSDEEDEDSDDEDEDLDDEDEDADDEDEDSDDEDEDSDDEDEDLDDEDEDADDEDEDADDEDEDSDDEDEDSDDEDEDSDDEDEDSDDEDEDSDDEDEDADDEDEDSDDEDEDDEATPDEEDLDDEDPDEEDGGDEETYDGDAIYRYLNVDCYELVVKDLDIKVVANTTDYYDKSFSGRYSVITEKGYAADDAGSADDTADEPPRPKSAAPAAADAPRSTTGGKVTSAGQARAVATGEARYILLIVCAMLTAGFAAVLYRRRRGR